MGCENTDFFHLRKPKFTIRQVLFRRGLKMNALRLDSKESLVILLSSFTLIFFPLLGFVNVFTEVL